IMLTFEVQNVCLIYSARATGNEEYAISSLAAGVLNIGLTMILIKPLGLWGVSLATLLSLMLTNNWYALYKPLLRLKLNLKEYINKVVMIWLLSLVLSLFLGSTIKYLLSITNYNYSWLTLITSAIVSGVIFLIGIRSTVFIKKSKSSHIAQ
ncbi:MAG: hypothetical protein F6K09_32785, partial [Merismopedia sp. SIO2A8]|nr:hypothetical protein [Merismopedia sp. SIO2A8]